MLCHRRKAAYVMINTMDKRHDHTLVRGIDHGPYDLSEVDSSFLDELKYPASKTQARHSRDSDTDLPTHVWTKTLSFYVPAGVTVSEERVDDSLTDVLHVNVPQTKSHCEFMLHISAFYAPTSMKLWNEIGYKEAESRLESEGVKIELGKGLWGPTVSARSLANEIYIVGADGPRWSLRVIADGVIVNENARKITRDVVDSAVVHRVNGAFAPGSAFDISLIDRRVGHNPSSISATARDS